MENLKWFSEGSKFSLKNGDETIMKLSINLAGESICNINDREYQIYKKGAWNSLYYVFADGQEIARLCHGIWGSSGKIAFADGAEYNVAYRSKDGFKIRFMDEENEILEYGVVIMGIRTTMKFKVGISMIDAEKLLLLAALGMIIFFPILKEITGGTDGDMLF